MTYKYLSIFLDVVGLPIASWFGLAVSAIFGLLYYLLKISHNRLLKDMDDLSKDISDISKDVQIERERSNKEMRTIDTRINDLHINILNKLDEIKYKFNEFRK